ncbi:arsenite efflux transporter metallochaperone ArsD [Paenisporosarcina macmurdoensis]|uniref:Arsenite efflux transporter metallochaperone ArsD n=1 Tax=Paenisporosarcina macmurdoensis TaxID=212659 RepID=A0ABW1LAB4_9BACL
MSKVEIFDPALCCPTGVCGPSVDPKLTRLAAAVFTLEKKGFEIKRYNLGIEPIKFVENQKVNQILHDKGPDALPVVVVNDEIVKVGDYPSNEELANWFDIEESELSMKKPKIRLDVKFAK